MYIVNWNVAGYLPDSESVECYTLAEARAAAKEMARDIRDDWLDCTLEILTPLRKIYAFDVKTAGPVEYAAIVFDSPTRLSHYVFIGYDPS